jgi:hypothetical protein
MSASGEVLVCIGCGCVDGHPEGCDLGGYVLRDWVPCVGCGLTEGHTEMCDLGRVT